LVVALMVLLAGCTAAPPNAKPLSPTNDIITPEGNKVPCTVSPAGVCVQP
jgi:hypothetical protein